MCHLVLRSSKEERYEMTEVWYKTRGTDHKTKPGADGVMDVASFTC